VFGVCLETCCNSAWKDAVGAAKAAISTITIKKLISLLVTRPVKVRFSAASTIPSIESHLETGPRKKKRHFCTSSVLSGARFLDS
jgi:hypothetical protein